MRYLTYELNGAELCGVLIGENVYPIHEITGFADIGSLLCLIESGRVLPGADGIISSGTKPVPLAGVKLMAPIPYPRREIIALGKNYEDHINEIKATAMNNQAVPKLPVYFGKSAHPAIGCGGFIPTHPDVTSQIDYESELAVIIGKPCDNIGENDVYDHIFGYTVLNDVTARDVQLNHGQWYLGKSLSGFCPMGPVIADKDEIPDPCNLGIYSRVNGEARQSSNTRFMIFSIKYVISQLSRGFKLFPGDIVATGTPAGVGHGFSPPKNLKKGDTVECEIEGIGILKNFVGDPSIV